MPKNTKQHRYLIAGEVHFLPVVDGEDVAAPQAAKVNAVISVDSKKLGAREIGRAQQALQMNHHKQMEDPESYRIFDVFLINFVYLGLMSDADFQNKAQMEEKEVSIDLPMLSASKH